MKTALVAVAKDEDHYIDEWVEYHQKIGFDDVYIYGDEWELPEPTRSRKGVFFENWERKKPDAVVKNPQVGCYRDFCKKHWKEYDWAAFFDVDEFLFIKETNNELKPFLEKHGDCPGVFIQWLMFGSNNLQEVVDGDWSVIERFVQSDDELHPTGKTMVNFSVMKNDFLMHCHNIEKTDKFKVQDLFGNEVEGVDNKSDFDRHNLNMAYLAHYRTKSHQEFLEKVKRNLDGYGDKDWTIHEKDFKDCDKNEILNLDLRYYINSLNT